MQVYLGKEIPMFGIKELAELPAVELPLSDFLDHVFICGSAGCGKTVLGKAIIEDFAQSGIPAIIIDTKGHLGSLGLVFSEYKAESFISWITPSDKLDVAEAAKIIAKRYRHRLQLFNISPRSVKTLNENNRVTIFTPNAHHGVRLAVPTLPAAPLNIDEIINENSSALHEAILPIAQGLVERLYLGKDLEYYEREYNFLVQLIADSWKKKTRLEGISGLKRLVDLIQEPPMKMIGAFPMDRYIMSHQRKDLALRINSLIILNEQRWYQGLPLNMTTLLAQNTRPAKTQISVIDLSQLGCAEEQSFVTAQVIQMVRTWMRNQGETNKPRLLFYIDELHSRGARRSFFPGSPGTTTMKGELLRLLGSAKDYGVAVTLGASTPLNLDYKALSACKTWMIGYQSNAREWHKLRKGLRGINSEVDSLARDNNLAVNGEFILKRKNNQTCFFHQRWISSFHRPFSIMDVKRYTAENVFPQTTSVTREVAVNDDKTMAYADEPAQKGCYLIVLDGEQKGEQIELCSGETPFGRKEFCPGNPKVSRKHFRIISKDDQYFIRDTSTNGTFIGGRRIDIRRLEPDDEITLGKDEVRIQFIRT